jgi:hypothetical protein
MIASARQPLSCSQSIAWRATVSVMPDVLL